MNLPLPLPLLFFPWGKKKRKSYFELRIDWSQYHQQSARGQPSNQKYFVEWLILGEGKEVSITSLERPVLEWVWYSCKLQRHIGLGPFPWVSISRQTILPLLATHQGLDFEVLLLDLLLLIKKYIGTSQHPLFLYRCVWMKHVWSLTVLLWWGRTISLLQCFI